MAAKKKMMPTASAYGQSTAAAAKAKHDAKKADAKKKAGVKAAAEAKKKAARVGRVWKRAAG